MSMDDNYLWWTRLSSRDQLPDGTPIQTPFIVFRSRVPGGWLVAITNLLERGDLAKTAGITFYPDPEHKWDGHSLPG